MRTNRTIGMSQVQFGELVRRVEELVTGDEGVGRPRGVTWAQGLTATLRYVKDNITEEVIAELVFVSQSVISETISTLDGVIGTALQDFESDLTEAADGLAGRVAVIDGSLPPCWSWTDNKDLWSGKHQETGHQHHYGCDLAGEPAIHLRSASRQDPRRHGLSRSPPRPSRQRVECLRRQGRCRVRRHHTV